MATGLLEHRGVLTGDQLKQIVGAAVGNVVVKQHGSR
jgi:hypothetical protein